MVEGSPHGLYLKVLMRVEVQMQLYTKILIGMVVGITLGLLLGPNSFLLPHSVAELSEKADVRTSPDGKAHPLAKGAERARILSEQDPTDEGVSWLEVEWTLTSANLLKFKAEKKAIPAKATAGSTARGWVIDSPPEVRRVSPIGLFLVDSTYWLGALFLALIKMVVVPLVFFSLVVGVATLGDLRDLGRLGSRTIGYFFSTTVAALVIGIGLANIVKPGNLLSAEDKAILTASFKSAAESKVEAAANAPTLTEQVVALVPTNPIQAMAEGDKRMLQVIVFAVLLGIALTIMKRTRDQLVIDVFERLNDAMIMLVHIAMALAPYGVAALLFKVAGTTGPSVLLALAGYSLLVLVGLLLHVTLVYGSVIKFGARLPFWKFFGAIREALLLAFSTSSSSATLPVTKECCEQNLGTSSKVSSFVLPLGATINMDGTALYQAVATLFIAQVYLADTLTFADQLTIIFSATLASVGAAGVPGAGMVTLAMVLTAVNVPVEGLALILGVDRLLDMFRTMTNVVGDAAATSLMARLEGEKLEILSPAADRDDPSRGFEGRLQHEPDDSAEEGG